MHVVGDIFRLGRMADFLSRPVLAGYVFGSGVLVVTSQLQGFLGTSIDPEPYLTDVGAVARHLDEAAAASVASGAGSLFVVVACRWLVPVVTGALVAEVDDAASAFLARTGGEPPVRPGEASPGRGTDGP